MQKMKVLAKTKFHFMKKAFSFQPFTGPPSGTGDQETRYGRGQELENYNDIFVIIVKAFPFCDKVLHIETGKST
jgi:hypothetical protein